MIGKRIISFDKIDSTNDYAKKEITSLKHGDIILALEQSSGRGRYNRKWLSKKGNLYFSIVIKEKHPREHIFRFNIKTAVVLLETLKKYGLEAKIKYPNDILIGKQKICGVLLESIGYEELDALIIGVGINVNQTDFEDYSLKASSIKLQTNSEIHLNDVLSEFLKVFNRHIDHKEDLKIYLDNSLILHREIVIDNDRYIIDTINEDGKIILKNSNRVIEKNYDEVSFTEIYDSI
jgi:BirA family biotin operon repressor/biotin-[acetyl-CoA-carboxylase] ligase